MVGKTCRMAGKKRWKVVKNHQKLEKVASKVEKSC